MRIAITGLTPAAICGQTSNSQVQSEVNSLQRALLSMGHSVFRANPNDVVIVHNASKFDLIICAGFSHLSKAAQPQYITAFKYILTCYDNVMLFLDDPEQLRVFNRSIKKILSFDEMSHILSQWRKSVIVPVIGDGNIVELKTIVDVDYITLDLSHWYAPQMIQKPLLAKSPSIVAGAITYKKVLKHLNTYPLDKCFMKGKTEADVSQALEQNTFTYLHKRVTHKTGYMRHRYLEAIQRRCLMLFESQDECKYLCLDSLFPEAEAQQMFEEIASGNINLYRQLVIKQNEILNGLRAQKSNVLYKIEKILKGC